MAAHQPALLTPSDRRIGVCLGAPVDGHGRLPGMAGAAMTAKRLAWRGRRRLLGLRPRQLGPRGSEQRRRQLAAADYSGSRRIDIGSGPYPSDGYIHIDSDPSAKDLDLLADAWQIPLPDQWATEIRAVHVVEHIPLSKLGETLAEWRRLLQPGGALDVHVPNGASLARVILASEHEVHDNVWPAVVALFGYTQVPLRAPINPDEAVGFAEHQVAFTASTLIEILQRAGFNGVRLADEDRCRHTGPWDEIIPDFCLRVVGAA